MGTHPIGERPMNSAERSQRSLRQQRQEMNDIRCVLKDSAELHMYNGRLLAALGKTLEAHDCFVMVEIHNKAIENINKRLANWEHEFTEKRLAVRKGRTAPDPRANLVLTGFTQQKAYEAARAARRPEINALYGHLAKAEKADAEEKTE